MTAIITHDDDPRDDDRDTLEADSEEYLLEQQDRRASLDADDRWRLTQAEAGYLRGGW